MQVAFKRFDLRQTFQQVAAGIYIRLLLVEMQTDRIAQPGTLNRTFHLVKFIANGAGIQRIEGRNGLQSIARAFRRVSTNNSGR